MGAGMIALAAIPIITSLIQGIGQKQEADQKSAYARYNAQVSEDQARATAAARDFQLQLIERRKAKMLSKQVTLYAKAGVKFEGSPIEVIAGTATEFALDSLAENYNSAMQISALQSEARLSRMQAGDLKRGGNASMLMTVGSGVANAALTYGMGSKSAATKKVA